MNADSLWKQIEAAVTEEERINMREVFLKEGYSLLYECLESIKDRIKRYEEDGAERITQLIKQAEAIIPSPESISPAWANIWGKLRHMISSKNDILSRVPQSDRDGEWQVILDNPYSNDPIVCYPHLSFLESVYLYSYFRADLMNNEYVRLQKIVTMIQSEKQ